MSSETSFDLKATAGRLEKDTDTLSRFSRPGPGVTRLSFTSEYRGALSYLTREFEDLGFKVGYDPVGNFLASNVAPGERCIALGSHVDSVPYGGRFDGTAGVLCALEVARTTPDTPLKVFSFVEEEGARFGSGILGGRCAAGLVSAEELKNHCDMQGTSFYEAAQDAGYAPSRVRECPANLEGVERYLEVHIEQGRVLEEAGDEIGVVEAIAGMVHATLEIKGRTDHAGATPMRLRSDASLTAAEAVVELERLVQNIGGYAVGTVGRLELHPGALNVIPGYAAVGLDVRDADEERISDIVEQMVAFAQERGEMRGQKITYREHLRALPAFMGEGVVGSLIKAAEREALPHRKMFSGAGHDAMMVAKRVPAGMLFVPSRDGISHAPEEFTQFRHLAGAVAVLLRDIKDGW